MKIEAVELASLSLLLTSLVLYIIDIVIVAAYDYCHTWLTCLCGGCRGGMISVVRGR